MIDYDAIKKDAKKLQKKAKSAIASEKEAKEERVATEKQAEEERLAKEKAEQEKLAAEQAAKEAEANQFTSDKAIQMAKASGLASGSSQYTIAESASDADGVNYYMIEVSDESSLFYIQVFEDGRLYDIPAASPKADSYYDDY